MPPPLSPEPHRTTLDEVARAAGVHPSTVSRVLNRPGRINERTAVRVRAAAERLGYVPNRAARLLAGGRTGAIALVLPDLGNPFFASVARAVQRRALAGGSLTFMAHADATPATELDLVATLGPNVDGFVLCAPTAPTARLRDALGPRPGVLVNRRAEGLASVVADQKAAVAQAVGHLRDLGHDRIVYLRGPAAKWTSSVRDREADRLGAALLGPYEASWRGGAAAAPDVRAGGFTAAVAHNDLVAIGLVGAVLDAGATVPGDLSVVGCDDIAAAALTRPRLTTVAAPLEEVGAHAVDLLLGLVAGTGGEDRAIARRALPVELVVRDTTGPPPRGPRA